MDKPAYDLRDKIKIIEIRQEKEDKRRNSKIGDVIGYKLKVYTEVPEDAPLYVKCDYQGAKILTSKVKTGRIEITVNSTMLVRRRSLLSVMKYLAQQQSASEVEWISQHTILVSKSFPDLHYVMLTSHKPADAMVTLKKMRKVTKKKVSEFASGFDEYFHIMQNWVDWAYYERHLENKAKKRKKLINF